MMHIKPIKPIVIDLDGAVADFTAAVEDHFGEPNSRSEYSLETWYPCMDKAYLEAFVNDPQVYADLQMIKGAWTGLEELKARGHTLIVVTARPLAAEDATRQWIRENGIGYMITETYVVGRKDKANKIDSLCPIAALDDDLYLLNSLNVGINRLLFTQPWNLKYDVFPKTLWYRVLGWDDIRTYFNLLDSERSEE